MRAAALLDTNVLLYAISGAPGEAIKKGRARELLARDDYGLSVQVLQEFYVNATRSAMTHAEAVRAVLELSRRPVIPTDVRLMTDALQIKSRYQLSYWDAAIIAAAARLEAKTVYSEDLNHGQAYAGIRVTNPFL